MSYIAEYKHGVIDDDEYEFEARRFDREEREIAREMDYLPEKEEDEE